MDGWYAVAQGAAKVSKMITGGFIIGKQQLVLQYLIV
jgi:hypothetical protein